MSNLFVLKEQLQAFYAKYSKGIDKMIQLLLAFIVFYLINSKMGFMETFANPVVTVVLAVICAFLPCTFTVIASAVLMLIHMQALSMGVLLVAAAIFAVMLIFYFRFAPDKAIIVLLMVIAFCFKIPFAVPIAFALTSVPTCIIPICFGTIIYYIMTYLEVSSTVVTGADGITGQMTLFATQVMQNSEMWTYVASFAVCVLIVYTVRRSEADHSWKIAMAAGAVADIIVIVAGGIALNIQFPYITVIFGNIISVILALILEFCVFSVDYSRAEKFQYEDDEYYYYVKAIPKVSVTVPEKKVKQISKRRHDRKEEGEENQTESKAEHPKPETREGKKTEETSFIPGMTEELLLAKRLQEEIDLEEIIKKELQDKEEKNRN